MDVGFIFLCANTEVCTMLACNFSRSNMVSLLVVEYFINRESVFVSLVEGSRS